MNKKYLNVHISYSDNTLDSKINKKNIINEISWNLPDETNLYQYIDLDPNCIEPNFLLSRGGGPTLEFLNVIIEYLEKPEIIITVITKLVEVVAKKFKKNDEWEIVIDNGINKISIKGNQDLVINNIFNTYYSEIDTNTTKPAVSRLERLQSLDPNVKIISTKNK